MNEFGPGGMVNLAVDGIGLFLVFNLARLRLRPF